MRAEANLRLHYKKCHPYRRVPLSRPLKPPPPTLESERRLDPQPSLTAESSESFQANVNLTLPKSNSDSNETIKLSDEHASVEVGKEILGGSTPNQGCKHTADANMASPCTNSHEDTSSQERGYGELPMVLIKCQAQDYRPNFTSRPHSRTVKVSWKEHLSLFR